jgi:predicted nuclease of predicted toxin-antitoxin system
MLPPLVADMDIAAPVVHFLRAQDVDILSAREEGWGDLTDSQILARAHAMTRFVLTHDSDFWTLNSLPLPRRTKWRQQRRRDEHQR